jgi:hypothetical protein
MQASLIPPDAASTLRLRVRGAVMSVLARASEPAALLVLC